VRNADKEKIVGALLDLRRLKWLEDHEGGSEYNRGIASVAESMLSILTEHGAGYPYLAAVDSIVSKGRAARRQCVSKWPALEKEGNNLV